jgi:hypothetical protein
VACSQRRQAELAQLQCEAHAMTAAMIAEWAARSSAAVRTLCYALALLALALAALLLLVLYPDKGATL